MPVSRRSVLIGAAAALAPSAGAAADLLIKPLLPTSGQATRYARFAEVGDHQLPKRPSQVEPFPGLRLLAFMPMGVSHAPLVVFSHGELAEPNVYTPLLSHWASHGFAVLAPLHDDSVIENGLRIRRSDPRTGGNWDLGAVLNDADAWRARAHLCRMTLDAVSRIEASTGVKLLTDHTVVAGHSYGAYIAQLLCGARAATADGSVLDVADRRFYGAMLLSPQGRGAMGLTDGSWDGMDKPMLAVTGKGDEGAGRADTKLEPFTLSPPGNKHLAWFADIKPAAYSGQQARSGAQSNVAVFQDLLAVTTAFLFAYARQDQDVMLELAGDYYNRMTRGRVTTYYR